MEILSSVLGKIGEHVWESIKFHSGYLKNYEDNIKALEKQLETLEEMEEYVHEVIEAAERNGDLIRKSVQHWIASVEVVKMDAKEFLEEKWKANNGRCFKGWCPDLRTRYSLAKEAMEMHYKIESLCEEQAVFDSNVSLPAPPSGIDSITSKDIVLFRTTKLAMEQVMDALKEDSTNFVGIHGMGGVGKTTLVKEIARKCKEEMLFDNVVMAVVSQIVSMESIQQQIADSLCLRLEEKTVVVRASRLKNRLTSLNNILVILDDVWERLELNTIGIPLGEDHKGCKVVITTRRRQVCTAMGSSVQATRIVSLDVLTEEESWELFQLQVGDIIESPTVAKKLVRECGGLPIALVTVGKAMRDKDIEEWEEAALELEKLSPMNAMRTKLIYDYLRDEEHAACFSLCCLFPKDYDIEIESLVRYAVGLNKFENVDKIQEVRRRVHSIINNLKDSSLLVASEKEGCIKMLGVFKTMASENYLVKAGEGLKEWPEEVTQNEYDGKGISVMRNRIQKYPDAWKCPNLEILLMQYNNIMEEQEMSETVFKGMQRLRVLDQSCLSGKRSLEKSFFHLENLQTLIIEGPISMQDITALGDLKKLQIISFRYCTFEGAIDALTKLHNLRLLDLTDSTNCSSLFNFTNIAAAAAASSSRLEELYVTETMSYDLHQFNVAKLMKYFPLLHVLKFRADDIRCIPENFVFPYLHNFVIIIGKRGFLHVKRHLYHLHMLVFANVLHLHGICGEIKIPLRSSIGALLSRVNILNLFCLNGFRNILPYLLVADDSLAILKVLHVQYCSELEYLIGVEEQSQNLQQHGKLECFSDLEELHLLDLSSFRGICQHNCTLLLRMPTSFLKVKRLEIFSCPNMSNIGVPFDLLQRMQELQSLEISDCAAVEYLFDLKEEEGIAKNEDEILANLTELELVTLPRLQHLWKGPTEVLHLCNLKRVGIGFCPKLKILFHWCVARRLEELEYLKVHDCDELEEIIGQATGEGEEDVQKVLFPELQHLSMWRLPKLVGFYTGNLPGNQSTPKLKSVRMGQSGSEVERELDGRNLDTVIKDNKGLLQKM